MKDLFLDPTLFENKKVIITGGAGFLGSTLAHRLLQLKAKVIVVDNFYPHYGANEFNLQSIRSHIELVRESVTNEEKIGKIVDQTDYIFHIAGQCSHIDSMSNPWLDLEFNCKGTLTLLELLKKKKLKTAFIYAGTRAILGSPDTLPVSEHAPIRPVDIYGVHKMAAEWYGAVYAKAYQIPFISLRLTNCFGPRHQMKNGKYGILNWFISLGLQKKPIRIFGNGEQLRDYVYVDDAIDSFLRAGAFVKQFDQVEGNYSQVQLAGKDIPFAVFNISSGQGLRFVDCARKIADALEVPIEFVPWTAERAAIETGDFVASPQAAKELLGWEPQTSFDEGLKKTIEYYQSHMSHYL